MSQRRRESIRAGVLLTLGLVQTSGAVTTMLLYLNLGLHPVTWTAFTVTLVALLASWILQSGNR